MELALSYLVASLTQLAHSARLARWVCMAHSALIRTLNRVVNIVIGHVLGYFILNLSTHYRTRRSPRFDELIFVLTLVLTDFY